MSRPYDEDWESEQYLPDPEDHARECWKWFRDMVEGLHSEKREDE